MIHLNLKGGLGNQLFEYATARSIQMTTGEKIFVNISDLNCNDHDNYSLDHFNITNIEFTEKKYCFWFNIINILNAVVLRKLKSGTKLLERVILNASKHGLYITIYNNPDFKFTTKNKYLNGYFQSPKYFDSIREILQNELSVKDNIMEQNEKYLNDIVNSNSVCVHVRRGDYVNNTVHEVCNISYYNESIRLLQDKIQEPKFFIFSDDIKWTKKNLTIKNGIFIDENNPNYEELRLMCSCKNFIISNSSFSWWAQYLSTNKKKIVVAPSKWYKDNKEYDLKQKDWILINID